MLGTLIPGLGLWRSGRRVLGGLIMGAILVAIGGLAALYVTNQRMVQQAVITPDVLKGAAIGLLILAALWVTVIGLTHLALRPANPSLEMCIRDSLAVGRPGVRVRPYVAVARRFTRSVHASEPPRTGASETRTETRVRQTP